MVSEGYEFYYWINNLPNFILQLKVFENKCIIFKISFHEKKSFRNFQVWKSTLKIFSIKNIIIQYFWTYILEVFFSIGEYFKNYKFIFIIFLLREVWELISKNKVQNFSWQKPLTFNDFLNLTYIIDDFSCNIVLNLCSWHWKYHVIT